MAEDNKPKRHGSRWTAIRIDIFSTSGMRMSKDIAETLDRTEFAIICQLHGRLSYAVKIISETSDNKLLTEKATTLIYQIIHNLLTLK